MCFDPAGAVVPDAVAGRYTVTGFSKAIAADNHAAPVALEGLGDMFPALFADITGFCHFYDLLWTLAVPVINVCFQHEIYFIMSKMPIYYDMI